MFPKVSVTVVDQPEEHCDLIPNNVCRHKTTLVPRLRPEPECVLVPQQVRLCHCYCHLYCHLHFLHHCHLHCHCRRQFLTSAFSVIVFVIVIVSCSPQPSSLLSLSLSSLAAQLSHLRHRQCHLHCREKIEDYLRFLTHPGETRFPIFACESLQKLCHFVARLSGVLTLTM